MDRHYAYDVSRDGNGRLLDAWRDIAASLRMWRIWILLGWRDFRNQTKRTVLGPLWSIIGLAITVGAIGHVYGALLSWPPEKGYPYIAAGFICWFFIASCLQGGLSVFLSNAGIIKERALPITFSVFRYTWRLFLEFGLKFAVFVIYALAVQHNPGTNVLFILPGLLLYFLTGLWINLLFGILGARARDLAQLVSPLLLIAFLSTPILWPKEALGDRAFFTDFNPLAYAIDIIRDPLLGQPLPLEALAVMAGLLVTGYILTLVVFARLKARLVFWL